MADKMDLIVAGPAGHVLAAVVRQNISGAQPDAAALAGSGLMVEDYENDIQLSIAPQYLSVQSIDLREDVLLTARNFVIVDQLPEEGKEPANNAVTLDGKDLTVNIVQGAEKGGTSVWVYIEGPPQPVVQQVKIDETKTTGSEPLPLPAGDYRALVLAPGYKVRIMEESVP